MSLHKKGTSFEIDWETLEKKMKGPFDKLKNSEGDSGNSIYEDAVALIHQYIAVRTEPKDSFLIFGMIFGQHAIAKKQADYIWDECWYYYDGDQNPTQVTTHIKKVLGTLLMVEIAKDDGEWQWEPDADKQMKQSIDQKPDAAIYSLRRKKE